MRRERNATQLDAHRSRKERKRTHAPPSCVQCISVSRVQPARGSGKRGDEDADARCLCCGRRAHRVSRTVSTVQHRRHSVCILIDFERRDGSSVSVRATVAAPTISAAAAVSMRTRRSAQAQVGAGQAGGRANVSARPRSRGRHAQSQSAADVMRCDVMQLQVRGASSSGEHTIISRALMELGTMGTRGSPELRGDRVESSRVATSAAQSEDRCG